MFLILKYIVYEYGKFVVGIVERNSVRNSKFSEQILENKNQYHFIHCLKTIDER